MNRITIALAALAALLAVSVGTHAATITTTLGNAMPGFADGDTPPLIPDILIAQAGQPAPFNAGIGNDLLGPNFMASWTFNYAALVDPILSASVTIGIADHDSAAAGSQLSLFSIDGNVFTAPLNGFFEASGGATDGRYNEYTVDLSGAFGDLTDGSATAQLNLQGPGLLTPLAGPPAVPSGSNGAFLIFSTLTIETQDALVMPEPATWGLLVLGLGTLLWSRRRPGAGTWQR